MWYTWEQRGIHAGFHCENLMEGDDLEGLDVDGRPIIKINPEGWDERMETGLIWLGWELVGGCYEYHY